MKRMNRKHINLIVILAILVVIIFISLGFMGFSGFNLGQQQAAPEPAAQGDTSAQALLDEIQATGAVTELKYVDLVTGAGEPIAVGDIIEVSYTGVLPNGTVFDATAAHGGVPLKLIVAPDGSLRTETGGGLIQGWSLGMAGMKEGGRRLLAIPPELGYGANSVGSIPPNSTLLFEVEVVSRTPSAQ